MAQVPMVSSKDSINVPLGASLLGYTKRVISEYPTLDDIGFDNIGNFKWFNGEGYRYSIPRSRYKMVNGFLSLESGTTATGIGGDIVTVGKDFKPGKIPLLAGKYGFYVEFEISVTESNADTFPSVWLMPVERNNVPGSAGVDDYYPDLYPSDPMGYERYMELDIDEGYLPFYTGNLGTVLSWECTTIYPDVKGCTQLNNKDTYTSPAIDRTQRHIFGASYDPLTRTVTWYVDGKFDHAASGAVVPVVAARQNFYLCVANQRPGVPPPYEQPPYSMYFHAVRAFVPEASPLPRV
jgi:hypothetical protein